MHIKNSDELPVYSRGRHLTCLIAGALPKGGGACSAALMQVNTGRYGIFYPFPIEIEVLPRWRMYNRVLVAYDGTGCAELALREAIRMAEEGAHLIVLAVADASSLPVRVARGEQADAGQAGFAAVEKSRVILELAARQVAARDIKADTLLVDLTESGEHNVARTILDEARNARADLIVMGTHGRHGFKRFLLGSVAERVVRESGCPVLLVRGDSPSAISCANPSEIYGQWPGDERIGH